MACRLKDNHRSASSDGVPPELAVLDFCGVSAPTGLTAVGATGLTGLREASLVKIDCDLHMLAHSCVDRICVNIF